MGASLTQGHAHFSFGCDFMVGLGKFKMCTKFEVSSFIRCLNIEVKPQIFAELPQPKAVHFSHGCDFLKGLGKSKLRTKFEVVSFSHCVKL